MKARWRIRILTQLKRKRRKKRKNRVLRRPRMETILMRIHSIDLLM